MASSCSSTSVSALPQYKNVFTRKSLATVSKGYKRKLARQELNYSLTCKKKTLPVQQNNCFEGDLDTVTTIEDDTNDSLNVSLPQGPFTPYTFNFESNIHDQRIPFDTAHEIPFDTACESIATQLSQWAVQHKITVSALSDLLKLLGPHHTLPRDARTLLKTQCSGTVQSMGNGKYFHFGIKHGILSVLKYNADKEYPFDIMKFDINVDGLPLTKSSSSQFWPILGALAHEDFSEPFIIGIYCGNSKPESVDIFLTPFINDYLELIATKLAYKRKEYYIRLDKIICDAPAKAFVLGVKGHNAYFGCTKCTTEGTYVDNRVTYPEVTASLRTDEGFKNKIYEDYHKAYTPLEKLNIGLVTQVPIDYMHLVCLGVMKKLLQFWVKGNRAVRMSNHSIAEVSSKLLEFRKSLPVEFARLPRELSELDRWKATEFRQFLFYSGPLIIKDHISASQYTHFMSLHCALRILATPSLCVKYNKFAKKLLKYFIKQYAVLYGAENVSYNVHNLIHLNEDVALYGPVDNFSSFKFENYMCKLKRSLKTSRHPLQQIIKRLLEEEKFRPAKTGSSLFTLLKENLHGVEINEPNVTYYTGVKFNNMNISISSKNCYILKNCTVYQVQNIMVRNENPTGVFLIAKKFNSFKSSYNSPCDSSLFNCGEVSVLSGEVYLVPLEEVEQKCIKYQRYIISIMHSHN